MAYSPCDYTGDENLSANPIRAHCNDNDKEFAQSTIEVFDADSREIE